MNRREFLNKTGATGLIAGAGVTGLAATGTVLWKTMGESEEMNMPNIAVNPQLCRHCRRCIYDCLAGILEEQKDGTPKMVEGGSARCFRCQHCMSVCPAGAISFFGKDPDNSDLPGEIPEAEKMQNLIRQRRSIRSYKEGNVEPAVLNRIKATLNYVPTGCNDHLLCFSYSEDRKITDNFRSAASTTVIDLIKTDKLPKRIAHFKKLKARLEAGKDVFFRTAPHFVAISVAEKAKDWYIDPYIAASQFELLATTFKLGTCWGGMATDLFSCVPKLNERLAIPQGYKLGIIMLFGYPDVRYPRLPQPEPYQTVSLQWPTIANNPSVPASPTPASPTPDKKK